MLVPVSRKYVCAGEVLRSRRTRALPVISRSIVRPVNFAFAITAPLPVYGDRESVSVPSTWPHGVPLPLELTRTPRSAPFNPGAGPAPVDVAAEVMIDPLPGALSLQE